MTGKGRLGWPMPEWPRPALAEAAEHAVDLVWLQANPRLVEGVRGGVEVGFPGDPATLQDRSEREGWRTLLAALVVSGLAPRRSADQPKPRRSLGREQKRGEP